MAVILKYASDYGTAIWKTGQELHALAKQQPPKTWNYETFKQATLDARVARAAHSLFMVLGALSAAAVAVVVTSSATIIWLPTSLFLIAISVTCVALSLLFRSKANMLFSNLSASTRDLLVYSRICYILDLIDLKKLAETNEMLTELNQVIRVFNMKFDLKQDLNILRLKISGVAWGPERVIPIVTKANSKKISVEWPQNILELTNIIDYLKRSLGSLQRTVQEREKLIDVMNRQLTYFPQSSCKIFIDGKKINFKFESLPSIHQEILEKLRSLSQDYADFEWIVHIPPFINKSEAENAQYTMKRDAFLRLADNRIIKIHQD